MPSRRVARRVRSSARVNASSVRRRRPTERAPEPNRDTNEPEVQPWYRRFWNYQPDPEAGWVQVVEQTGIPGVVEIARPNRHVSIRFYWVIACVLVGLCATDTIGWAMGKSKEHPVQVTTRTEEIFTALILFPTTDMALMKGFKKTQMEKFKQVVQYTYSGKKKLDIKWTSEEFDALSYCVGETCESKTSASSHLGISNMAKELGELEYAKMKKGQKTPLYDQPWKKIFKDVIVPFLKKSITNCNELVVGCIWSGSKDNCTAFFISSYSNFGGGMCSHNKIPEMVLRRIETIQSIMEEPMDDAETEWSKWEKFNMDEYFFAVISKDKTILNRKVPLRQAVAGQSTGLILIVASNPNDFVCSQQDSDGVKIGVHSIISEPNVGKSGLVALWNHETFISVIPDVILADKELKNVLINDRGCAFDGEIKLKYFVHYTRENCIQEKLSDEILAECNCTLISAPKKTEAAICNLEQLICAKNIEVNIFSNKSEEVYKDCLPRCIDVKYNTKLSSIPYSNDTAKQFQNYFNLSDGTLTAVIHVFMEDVSVMVKIRTVKHDTYDKVGLFAGIFGFTTGTSFMTVAYLLAAIILMIYLIVKWLYKRYQAKLFPFHKRSDTDATGNAVATEAVDGVVPVGDINAVEPFSNSDENIGGPSQPDDAEMAIFTIRNVPGPEPNESISRNTVFQYIP